LTLSVFILTPIANGAFDVDQAPGKGAAIETIGFKDYLTDHYID